MVNVNKLGLFPVCTNVAGEVFVRLEYKYCSTVTYTLQQCPWNVCAAGPEHSNVNTHARKSRVHTQKAARRVSRADKLYLLQHF